MEVLLEQKFKQRELPPEDPSNESLVNNAPKSPQPPSIPTPPVSPPILQLHTKAAVSSPPQRKNSEHILLKSNIPAKSSRDIRNWLQELGLEQYSNNFLREEIDMDIVHCLKEHHLVQMGIEGLRPRLVLLAAIEQLRDNHHKSEFFCLCSN